MNFSFTNIQVSISPQDYTATITGQLCTYNFGSINATSFS
jgi:hypothetical protein